MHYQESKRILEKINKAKRILLNVHRNPDFDSVGSSQAMYQALWKKGKKVDRVSPEPLSPIFNFLTYTKRVKVIDFSSFDFTKYDLFLILDAASVGQLTGHSNGKVPTIPTVVIDHHKTNTLQGDVVLIHEKASATAEIIYRLLKDWKVEIDKEIATALFSGIATDTVFFKYCEEPRETFSIANELLKTGADIRKIVNGVYDTLELGFVKTLAVFLNEMKVEAKDRFVWSAVSYRTYKKLGFPKGVREEAAHAFFRSIKGADFGVAILEEEPGKVSISFRSKEIDVSRLAKKFGGGGHQHAAGATIDGKYEDVVKKVINTLKKNFSV